MHGELPQELSVTALEVVGTGTGQADGNKAMVSYVSQFDDVKT